MRMQFSGLEFQGLQESKYDEGIAALYADNDNDYIVIDFGTISLY